MITINDYIKIKKVNISSDDLYSLSRLYLPMIGIDSLSIYNFLNNYDEEISVRVILDFLHFDNVGLIEYGLNKLEAFGLLKRYKNNKTNVHLFCFLKPLLKNVFLEDTFLCNLLIRNIGEIEYQKIKTEKLSLKGYTEETKTYDEVFKVKDRVVKVITSDCPSEIKNNIRFKNTDFDYVVFKMSFEEDELSEAVLNDSEFENEILKISYQYSLNESEMKKAILQSIAKNNDLRIEDIERRASYIYQNKENKFDDFPEKTPEEYVIDLTSEENDMMNFAIKLPINQALAAVSGGKSSIADIRDFNKLVDIHHIPTEVVNVLIFHLSKIKAGEIITYNYIEKIAVSWRKAGVHTAKDAIIHIREKEKEEKKPRYSKRVVEVSEWMKREQNESDKKSNELGDGTNKSDNDTNYSENTDANKDIDINQFFKKVTD